MNKKTFAKDTCFHQSEGARMGVDVALHLIFMSIATYGASWIIVQSKLMEKVRESLDRYTIGELTRCMVCTSFWVSMVLCISSLHYGDAFDMQVIARSPLDVMFVALWCVATTWFIALLTGDAE